MNIVCYVLDLSTSCITLFPVVPEKVPRYLSIRKICDISAEYFLNPLNCDLLMILYFVREICFFYEDFFQNLSIFPLLLFQLNLLLSSWSKISFDKSKFIFLSKSLHFYNLPPPFPLTHCLHSVKLVKDYELLYT